MRFCIGPLPQSFTPTSEWRAFKEPEPGAFVARATMYVGIPSFVLFSLAWHFLGFSVGGAFRDFGVVAGIAASLSLCGVLVVFHEVVHLIFHPQQASTANSVVGLMFKPFVFYAQYFGELSRARFLVVLLAPFIVISVIPLVVVYFFGTSSKLGAVLAFFSSANAAASSADIFGAMLCIKQVPSHARVRNSGWKSYWREVCGNDS
jgi:hypothetical protein